MNCKRKILISVTSIRDIGGTSSSIVNLLNEIYPKYDVSLCVLTNYISPNISLPSEIKIIKGSNYLRDVVISRNLLRDQNIFQKSIRNIRRIVHRFYTKDRGIEKALDRIKTANQYDAAIAFSDYEYNIKSKKCYDYYFILHCVEAIVKVAWIHNDPIKLGWTKNLVIKRLQSFDYIVNVSLACKKIFDNITPQLINKSKVVYNLYNINDIKSKAGEINISKNGINFVTVARIEKKQKRIDRIIKVVKRLSEDGYKNFKWTLVGNGSMLETFKSMIAEANLNHLINFVGLQSNPFPFVKAADAFVLSSDYEGFGMTIKEAQILGVPTFSTRYDASDEVIEIGKQGEICDNSTEGLFHMIKNILDNPEKLKTYRQYLIDNPINNDEGLRQFDCII